MRRFSAFLILPLAACGRRPAPPPPLVQKYQTSAGDLFRFQGERFVLLERRKALDIAVSPWGDEAYSYPDRLTISRRVEPVAGEFHGSRPAESHMENTEFAKTPVPLARLAFSPTGSRLAGGAADGTLWIWTLTEGGAPDEIQDAGEVRALAFSPDGKTLAAGLGTGKVRLWELAGDRLAADFGAAPVNELAYAADGRLAAACEDGAVLVRPSGGEPPVRLQASASPAVAVAWHPSGRVLVSGHADKTVRLWDAATGTPLAALATDVPANPLFPRGVERVAFSPDGARLAAAYADGEMRIWDSSAFNEKKKP